MLDSKFSLVVACVATSVATSAHAATVYTDSFARGTVDSPLALNGSTPTVDPSASTWTASTSYTTAGTSANVSGGGMHAAILPLSIAAGNIYTLTTTVTPTVGGQSWLALGFSGGTGTDAAAFFDATGAKPAVWLLYRNNGETQSFFGGSTGNGANGGTAPAGTPDTFTITLDTTPGLNASQFTISDTLGLISRNNVGAPLDLVANPVTGIAIGTHDGASGAFSALNVTAVPEPASMSLLGLAGSALIVRRRRRA